MNVFYAILNVDKARELVAGKVVKCGMCGQDIATGFPMDVANHVEKHLEDQEGQHAEYASRREVRLFRAKNLECAGYGAQAKWYGQLVEKLVDENQIDWKFLLKEEILVPVVGSG